ncbi:DNA-binding protein [Neorhizobium sp. SOG26]|nr:DNA-binding protein [Neorhizobium sp. SOG26]
MAGSSLREMTIPRFAMRRDEAAASLAISPSLFDNWIEEGRMPRGRKIGGVMLWDTEEVRSAWYRIVDRDASSAEDGENPFDRAIA